MELVREFLQRLWTWIYMYINELDEYDEEYDSERIKKLSKT